MKVNRFGAKENRSLERLYAEKGDIVAIEVSSGVYFIEKDRIHNKRNTFMNSRQVVTLLNNESRVALCGLEFTTVNFEINDNKKEGEK